MLAARYLPPRTFGFCLQRLKVPSYFPLIKFTLLPPTNCATLCVTPTNTDLAKQPAAAQVRSSEPSAASSLRIRVGGSGTNPKRERGMPWMTASSSLTLFEHALFRFWPKASGHRSLGHRPRAAKKHTVYWPKAMFTRYALSVNMAFGQTRPIAHDSWGDAPGYGD